MNTLTLRESFIILKMEHIYFLQDPKDEIKIMMLNLNEAGKFWNFLCFVDENDKNNYKLVFKYGSVVDSKLDTMCE